MPRGQPQIEVTFDVDANGILNVSAKETTTGKEQKITISNDGSRLSQDEIEQMVKDAEKFKEEDEKQKQTLEAKNNFENYIYHMKSTIQDDKLKEKLGDEYEKMEEKLKQAEQVLDVLDVSKEEYEKAQKELEDYMNPIMQKIVQEGGGETMDVPKSDENLNPEPEIPIDEID
jgi:L1 cell adhesion molecule like protein